jgi:hypothetical protein
LVTKILLVLGDVKSWVSVNLTGILFMKIKKEINTCSWGCSLWVREVHKIHEHWIPTNDDDTTVSLEL